MIAALHLIEILGYLGIVAGLLMLVIAGGRA